MPTYTSFNQLNAETMRRRGAGDRVGALELLAEHEPRFPHQAGVTRILRVEILAELGRADDAVALLRDALDRGFRYRGRWLRDKRFEPLSTNASFAALIDRSDREYERAQSLAKPELQVFTPDGDAPPDGWPLLVALHGNNSDIADTAPHWQAAVRAGWVLGVPQSSEIALTPGAFLYNDGHRAAAELDRHLIEIRRSVPADPSRTVLAGFSMGARQAIELVLGGRVAARGVMAIAAWLPDFEHLIESIRPATVAKVQTYVVVGKHDDSGYDGSLKLVEYVRSLGGAAEVDVHDGGHEYPAAQDAILAGALRSF